MGIDFSIGGLDNQAGVEVEVEVEIGKVDSRRKRHFVVMGSLEELEITVHPS